MSGDISRRAALKRLASMGLAANGAMRGVLASAATSPPQQALSVGVLESQSPMPLTLRTLINAKGYFRDFGIDPQMLSVTPGKSFEGAFPQRQADICIFSACTQLFAAIEKGADLKVLAGANLKGQQALFSKNPAIQSVRDLEGRTIGVGPVGAQLYQATAALLKKKGVDLGKVKFADIGSSEDVFRAVLAGTVDAGRGECDVFGMLDRLGIHMLKDGDYAVELPEYTWQVSFTSPAIIGAKREALVRTLAAYGKAYRYLQNPGSRDDFLNAYPVGIHATDRDEAMTRAVSMWNYLQTRKPYAEDLVLSKERVDYMQKLNIELGVQKRMLPYEQLVDTSVAREAAARLS
jgi:ABC-type nitrate/sulfonate/bicarbonate transport system substrate-binding protein